MHYTDDFIKRVKEGDVLLCFDKPKKKGVRYLCDCPECGKELALNIYQDNRINRRAAKCFHCGLFISNPIKAVQVIKKWKTNDRFPEAVAEAARLCGIMED